jgi:hypothetical protein
MDGDGRQDRSRTHLLDSEVYTDAEGQAILSAQVYVSKNALLWKARTKLDGEILRRGTSHPTSTISSSFIYRCPVVILMAPTGQNNLLQRFSN